MSTPRAAEMAQIMVEHRFGQDPHCEAFEFARRHFANDTLYNLQIAILIVLELEQADDAAEKMGLPR